MKANELIEKIKEITVLHGDLEMGISSNGENYIHAVRVELKGRRHTEDIYLNDKFIGID